MKIRTSLFHAIILAGIVLMPMMSNADSPFYDALKNRAIEAGHIISMYPDNPMQVLEDKPHRFEIVFFPLSFFVSGLEAGLEIPTASRQSVRISAGYFYSYSADSYNTFGSTYDGIYRYEYNEMEGFRTELQYRWYWHDAIRYMNSYENIYLALFGVYKTVRLEGERSVEDWTLPIQPIIEETYRASAASLGVLFGIKAVFWNKVAVDANFGGGITPTNIGDVERAHIPMVNPYRRSIHFKAGLALGILIH